MGEASSNEEVYRRLNTAEKEIYAMSKELLALQAAKPAERLGLLESSVNQIRLDVVNIEKISADMSTKLGEGLDELKMQAAVSRAQVKWIVATISVAWAVLQSWPIIKEIFKVVT